MSRRSPLDEAPIPPREWIVTYYKDLAFNNLATIRVKGDTIMQAIESFREAGWDHVRIISAVRL